MKPVFQFRETDQNETETGLASTNTPSDFWEDVSLGESSIPRQDSSPKFIHVKNFHFYLSKLPVIGKVILIYVVSRRPLINIQELWSDRKYSRSKLSM